jgi:hypothetical protein
MLKFTLENDTLHSCYILRIGADMKTDIKCDYNLANQDKVLQAICQMIKRLNKIY